MCTFYLLRSTGLRLFWVNYISLSLHFSWRGGGGKKPRARPILDPTFAVGVADAWTCAHEYVRSVIGIHSRRPLSLKSFTKRYLVLFFGSEKKDRIETCDNPALLGIAYVSRSSLWWHCCSTVFYNAALLLCEKETKDLNICRAAAPAFPYAAHAYLSQ